MGGEVKFQKFTDWSFDYMTYVLDTQWKEAKTCDIYAMARVSDKRWWFCFFFVMGALRLRSYEIRTLPHHSTAEVETKDLS